ncbi:phage tail protein [Pseudomonas bohemica]|uniref:phage tail protein n=1 Tax=Pseudomonas bohemica TaxID=2044872 RepID=UPI000DA5F9B0|nr:phage tail protein [Pseudomonas bohemica]
MPWYKAGTVSVVQNSSTVTGEGTAFAASARVGDAFLGPDGRWYELANVASDTVISILPAYQGADASAGTYALAPMQGYVKDSADQLRALVNQFGSLASAAPINALAALTGGADKLPYFTAADAMAVTSFPAEARTLLAATTKAAQRSSLGLGSAAVAAILGTVSQSGGTPTGSIMERGSTSNGWYYKFASGLMICYGTSAAIGTDTAFGSLYYSAATTFIFPATFTEVPQVLGFTKNSVNFFSWAVNEGTGPTTGQVSLRIVSGSSAATAQLQYVAIGRWY